MRENPREYLRENHHPNSTEEHDLMVRSTKKVKMGVPVSDEAPDDMDVHMEATSGLPHMDFPGENKERVSYRDSLLGSKMRDRENDFSFSQTGMLNLEKLTVLEPDETHPFARVEMDRGYAEGLQRSWDNALILRVLGKSINYNLLHAKINTMWKLQGDFELIDLGHSCFILKLENGEIAENILTGGPWVVANHYLVVRKWTKEFHPSTDEVLSAVAWIRIPELAIEYYKEEIIFCIAKGLGKPIKVGRNTFWASRGKYARICIEIDLSKPLRSAISVNGKLYPVVYENLPVICFDCGRVGHRSSACPKLNMEQETQPVNTGQNPNGTRNNFAEVVAENPYGDWMIVKRNKVGPKKTPNHKVSTNRFAALNPDQVSEEVPSAANFSSLDKGNLAPNLSPNPNIVQANIAVNPKPATFGRKLPNSLTNPQSLTPPITNSATAPPKPTKTNSRKVTFTKDITSNETKSQNQYPIKSATLNAEGQIHNGKDLSNAENYNSKEKEHYFNEIPKELITTCPSTNEPTSVYITPSRNNSLPSSSHQDESLPHPHYPIRNGLPIDRGRDDGSGDKDRFRHEIPFCEDFNNQSYVLASSSVNEAHSERGSRRSGLPDDGHIEYGRSGEAMSIDTSLSEPNHVGYSGEPV